MPLFLKCSDALIMEFVRKSFNMPDDTYQALFKIEQTLVHMFQLVRE